MEDNLTPKTPPSNEDRTGQPAAETQPAAENPSWEAVSDTDESEPDGRRISKKWALIGGILFVFLAAAVFLGAQLLKPPTTAAGDDMEGSGLTVMGGNGGRKSVRLDLVPAKELPAENMSTSGLFVKREDQSIFIGTGKIQISAKKSSDAARAPDDVSGSYDGPVVEVVINHQTKVYQDITDMAPPDESNDSGVIKMQQVVKPGSLDDLGKNTMVTVWGEKQGDRYIAKTIVFR